MSQKIVPNIWCNRNAEEVGAAYAAAFPGATTEVESRYPETGLLDFQLDFAGAPLTVAVTIPSPNPDAAATRLTLINAGDEFSPNSSLSFILNFDPSDFPDADGPAAAEAAAREGLDAVWRALSDGGRVLMPLQEYPFSRRYGWVEDRFGVSWQLMLTDPAGDPRPFLIPAFMFAGPVQNRAAEAIDHYVSTFPDAAAGSRFPYGAQTGPATAEALMFADFRIGEQWFAAMDSGVAQDTTFSCGVSLEVRCADQAEIDLLWDRLSAVPEAEQCGWLADRFGVSWQIVPENMGELMERPGAYERMMRMHKIVIAEF
ncbi:VOC family protein [Leucobacter allii]|uniref:VOC family protein n=1 Tax=Leucobacter allii TaxID=2932247 RepID=A0ABY4FPS2_9MICO|nr:VOC family protein [Leucobacter allii]UOQ58267.1 VOC family protein [Leucobacter allii]UOR02849.1 VOC family protein [Leucobacter allii]